MAAGIHIKIHSTSFFHISERLILPHFWAAHSLHIYASCMCRRPIRMRHVDFSIFIIIFHISELFSDLIIIFTSHNEFPPGTYFHLKSFDLHLGLIFTSRAGNYPHCATCTIKTIKWPVRSFRSFCFHIRDILLSFDWSTWQSEQICRGLWAGVHSPLKITCDPYRSAYGWRDDPKREEKSADPLSAIAVICLCHVDQLAGDKWLCFRPITDCHVFKGSI